MASSSPRHSSSCEFWIPCSVDRARLFLFQVLLALVPKKFLSPLCSTYTGQTAFLTIRLTATQGTRYVLTCSASAPHSAATLPPGSAPSHPLLHPHTVALLFQQNHSASPAHPLNMAGAVTPNNAFSGVPSLRSAGEGSQRHTHGREDRCG